MVYLIFGIFDIGPGVLGWFIQYLNGVIGAWEFGKVYYKKDLPVV